MLFLKRKKLRIHFPCGVRFFCYNTSSETPHTQTTHTIKTPPKKQRKQHNTAFDLLNFSRQTKAKHLENLIPPDANLFEAIHRLTQKDLHSTKPHSQMSNCLLVVEDQKQQKHQNSMQSVVVGICTQKDILHHLAVNGPEALTETAVSEIAIAAKDIIHVSPGDTLDDCRAVMSLCGAMQLPVLQNGRILGIISLTDIAALLYNDFVSKDGLQHSAKSDYMSLILPRKGLPEGTTLLESFNSDEWTSDGSRKSSQEKSFYFHAAAQTIPHPQKTDTGGEDAFFMGTSENEDWKTINKSSHIVCMGVADGVGSWFEKGVDPGNFSKVLMDEAYKFYSRSSSSKDVSPEEILNEAWLAVTQQNIIGSSTACVVCIDPIQGELHAVNLGDSGFIIVRDKRSDNARAAMRGTLDGSLSSRFKDDVTPSGRRKGAHVSYRSPQQLHYFNCPYQLGNVGDANIGIDEKENVDTEQKSYFETPVDAVQLRVPVFHGDLVIVATDGLFDNLDETELLEIVAEEARSDASVLVTRLANRAYELSLDRERDSPFARLAKENDIMWGGGIPDDITIIAARVVTN